MKCPFVIKVCTKCKRILVANEMNFCKEKKGKYGLEARCKECRKKIYQDNKDEISEKHKQYYQANKDEIKEKVKQYYESNKNKRKIYKKQWYEENKEDFLQKCKQYYEDNKDEISERNRQYKKDNPHIGFNARAKYRQRKENRGDGITKEQWLEMMQFFNWCCAYSGEYIGGRNEFRTIDHITPLSLGGEHEIWNLVPMLKSYNSSKNNKNMEDWYIEQEFFDIDRLLKIYEWIEYAYNKWK